MVCQSCSAIISLSDISKNNGKCPYCNVVTKNVYCIECGMWHDINKPDCKAKLKEQENSAKDMKDQLIDDQSKELAKSCYEVLEKYSPHPAISFVAKYLGYIYTAYSYYANCKQLVLNNHIKPAKKVAWAENVIEYLYAEGSIIEDVLFNPETYNSRNSKLGIASMGDKSKGNLKNGIAFYQILTCEKATNILLLKKSISIHSKFSRFIKAYMENNSANNFLSQKSKWSLILNHVNEVVTDNTFENEFKRP